MGLQVRSIRSFLTHQGISSLMGSGNPQTRWQRTTAREYASFFGWSSFKSLISSSLLSTVSLSLCANLRILTSFHLLIQAEGSKTERGNATASRIVTTQPMGSVSFQIDTVLKRVCFSFKVHVNINDVAFMSF